MKRLARSGLGALIAGSVLSGCSSVNVPPALPKSTEALAVERHFDLPFAVAWDQMLATANTGEMRVVSADKSSGQLTVRLPGPAGEPPRYGNLLLQPDGSGSETSVVVFTRTTSGPTSDRRFLEVIDAHLSR